MLASTLSNRNQNWKSRFDPFSLLTQGQWANPWCSSAFGWPKGLVENGYHWKSEWGLLCGLAVGPRHWRCFFADAHWFIDGHNTRRQTLWDAKLYAKPRSQRSQHLVSSPRRCCLLRAQDFAGNHWYQRTIGDSKRPIRHSMQPQQVPNLNLAT